MTLAQLGGLSVSWDFNTATLVAIVVNIVIVVVYMVKTNGTSKQALALAQEAKHDAKEVSIQVAAVAGNLALLREQVARDHPTEDDLRNMEKRLTAEISDHGKRLTTEVHHISDRLDELLRSRS